MDTHSLQHVLVLPWGLGLHGHVGSRFQGGIRELEPELILEPNLKCKQCFDKNVNECKLVCIKRRSFVSG